jgi:hypothetical protein
VEVINYKITVDTKSAQKNTTDLTGTIQEQKDITLEFERELRRLEEQLGRTSKSNLTAQKQIKDQMLQVKSALKDQKLSLRELNNEKSKQVKLTDINTKSLFKNYGVVQLLDQVTGGLASQVRSVVDANRLFNISLKGTRTALIATGVGAFVVALGLIVAYWDDIVDLISGANKEIQEQNDLLDISRSLLDKRLKFLEDEKKYNNENNISNEKLIEKQKELLLLKAEGIRTELKNLKLQYEKENSLARQQTFWETITNQAPKVTAEEAKALADRAEKILDLNEQLKQTTRAYNELNAAVIITPEKTKEEAKKENDPLEKQKELGDNLLNYLEKKAAAEIRIKEGLTNAILAEEERLGAGEVEIRRGTAEDILNAERALIEGKQALRNNDIDNARGIINIVGLLANETKELQAGLLIATNAAGIAKTIVNTQSANAIAISEGVALAIPTFGASTAAAAALVAANNINAGISIAASIAATVNGLSQIGAGGSSGSGGNIGGGGRTPAAPSFNLVQGSATNQIANSLQRSNEPIKAFVVSKDMTNKQELDRTIQQGSVL